MQLSTKPLEQLVEPEASARATPEPVVQDTTRFVRYLEICLAIYCPYEFGHYKCNDVSFTCSDTVVEVKNIETTNEVKEASPEKPQKKEEPPRSRDKERDIRRERPHHRSRSHSRSRRRRSRSR